MRQNKLLLCVTGALFAGWGAVHDGHARQFQLAWSTLDGGGVATASGGGLTVSGTIGQFDAGGPLCRDRFELTGGFWFVPGPGDCNADGVLNLGDCRTLSDCVTGPAQSMSSNCVCLDLDNDRDVDLRDFAAMQGAFQE
ncbi:MAG: hypothetical protein J5J06_11000 [Phycisphaerae bacterium]|nr:hypothetical protein [Phycisphaerae bacterium]